jgi:hypothetical protein
MPDAVKKDPGMRRVRGISKFRLREFVKNVKASADGQLAGESMGKHIEAIKKGHEIVQEVTGKLSELTQILTGNKPAKPEPELSPKLPPKKPARPETRGRLRRGRAMHRSPHGPSAA